MRVLPAPASWPRDSRGFWNLVACILILSLPSVNYHYNSGRHLPSCFFFFLGAEALPREVPWGAFGHRHTGDEHEGDPRMDCESAWSEMCIDKEPIQYGTWKGWESLHPSGRMTSSFPDESQNLDVQMRKQLKAMLLSSNIMQ